MFDDTAGLTTAEFVSYENNKCSVTRYCESNYVQQSDHISQHLLNALHDESTLTN